MRTKPALVRTARPYQLDGARFALKGMRHHRAALLADDPGLGKTLEAMLVMYGLDARRVLVVGPAIARGAWRVELHKHWPERVNHLYIPAFGDRPGPDIGADDIILVLSYDVFSQPRSLAFWAPVLRAHHWDLLILDECQYLKSDSNRTRALYGGVGKATGLQATAEKVLLLSGTPCPNHAGELFPHYTTFWRDLLMHEGKPLGRIDWEERYTRYTDGPWGRAVHGSRSQEVLREAFGSVILRRRRHEVLTELPPLQIQDVPLVVNDTQLLGLQPVQAQINHLMALPMDALLPLLSTDQAALATLRRLLGEAKAGPAAAWVRERLEQGVNKILIFAWHVSVIEQIARELHDYGPVVITGATSPEARERNVYSFQTEPSVRVFVGQTRAAGSAITLTRATDVAIVEPSWVPGENDQAIARAWRMGQTRPVLASFLYVPSSLDQKIMSAFRRKAEELVTLYVKDNPPTHEETRETTYAGT